MILRVIKIKEIKSSMWSPRTEGREEWGAIFNVVNVSDFLR